MYWQLVELAIQAMSPSAFEDLVFALVRIEHEDAEQLGPPDAGRDTIVRLPGAGELVWQAKHHTAGIDWGKCEESLKTALDQRDPREVTFVFPVKLNATKEPGLKDLRDRYPQVEITKPWTLPELRAKLVKADDVRPELIDQPIGVDELHTRHLLERAATRHQAFEAQTSAAMLGPLLVTGQAEALAEAEQLEAQGDPAGASTRLDERARHPVGDRGIPIASEPAVRAGQAGRAARIRRGARGQPGGTGHARPPSQRSGSREHRAGCRARRCGSSGPRGSRPARPRRQRGLVLTAPRAHNAAGPTVSWPYLPDQCPRCRYFVELEANLQR